MDPRAPRRPGQTGRRHLTCPQRDNQGDHVKKTGLIQGAVLALALLAAAPARAETVRMTVSYYSAATGPYFEKMAASFHAANPSIDVRIEVVNWPALLQKLQTDIAGNSNADLAII